MLRTFDSCAVMLSRRAVAAASSRSESRRIRSACSFADPTRAVASLRADSSRRADSSARAARSSSASRASRSARSWTAARAWSWLAICAVNSAEDLSRRSPRVRSKSAAWAAAVARCFSKYASASSRRAAASRAASSMIESASCLARDTVSVAVTSARERTSSA